MEIQRLLQGVYRNVFWSEDWVKLPHMKVLVTGAAGQLGLALGEMLPRAGYEVTPLSRNELDITEPQDVEKALATHSPDLVVNAAAYTDVDGCETDREGAYKSNALGPRNLAVHCERNGCGLLHVSTNYVFSGESKLPYEPFDQPRPTSVYGATKLAGEEYVRDLCNRWYIVRSAGVYGQGHNFVRTMLRLSRERDTLKVKNDEYIAPTYARDLAESISRVIEGELYGVYHVTNSGACSWYEFAEEIFTLTGAGVELLPVPASDYPLPAPRPANGLIASTGSPVLRHWREALEEYLEQAAV